MMRVQPIAAREIADMLVALAIGPRIWLENESDSRSRS
jgi:hypothetical protein